MRGLGVASGKGWIHVKSRLSCCIDWHCCGEHRFTATGDLDMGSVGQSPVRLSHAVPAWRPDNCIQF